MGLIIIVKGDKNSSGGTVIEGSANHTIMGKGIARLGDNVDCPGRYPGGRPHGVNPIIQGEGSYLVDGIPIALHGFKSACGCSLIGSMDATAEQGSVVQLTSPQSSATETKHSLAWKEVASAKNVDTPINDEQFLFKDANGHPMANMAYTVRIKSSSVTGHGVTDASGLSQRILTKGGERDIEIYWGHME